MRRFGLSVVLVSVTACSLSLDGYSNGAKDTLDGGGLSPTSEGGTVIADSGTFGDGSTPMIDGGSVATVAPPATGGGVIVARNVSKYAGGAAQKHHVHYAANLGAWLIFYFSATDHDHLLVKATTDFVKFIDGPPVPLPKPHDDDGRNFDVSVQSIGGADIFYVAYSTHLDHRYSYVLRGRGQGGTVTWGSPRSMGEDDTGYPESDPDAPAIALLPNGQALHTSGFNSVNGHFNNFVAFHSTAPDDGSAGFVPDFDTGNELEVANKSVNARAIVPTTYGAIALAERGDDEPNPTDIAFTNWQAGAFTGVASFGFGKTNYDVNDWDVVGTEDGRAHTVRFANGTYEHRYYEVASGGHAGFPIQGSPHSVGDGLVLLDLGGAATMAAIDTDRVIRFSKLQNDAWSPWDVVVAADPARKHLSAGSSGGASVLLWEVVNNDGTSDLAAIGLQ